MKFTIETDALASALEVIDAEDARLHLSEDCGHLMIEEGKFKEVIMPMRTQ